MDKDFITQNMTLENSKKINAIKLAQNILQDANDYNGLIMVGDAINYVLKFLDLENKKFHLGQSKAEDTELKK